MQEFEMKAISKNEWALIELVRSKGHQKVTIQVENFRIVNVKREENLKMDKYQPKLVPSN